MRRPGLVELLAGALIIVASWIFTALGHASDSRANGKFVLLFVPLFVGIALIVRGAVRLSPTATAPMPPRPDARRWIYGGLALVFAAVQVFALLKLIPNRLPTAAVHLWSFPLLTIVMAGGTLAGRRHGWWTAVIAGSIVLASTVLVIARILASAAFLAGTYGAFGKAASTFSFVAVALIINAVALLPVAQIKWLMSRAGRRAYGV